MKFYTYVWYDPDWIPYYVGKGVGTRSHARRDIPHPEEGHVVLKHFDLEEEAFEHEKALIAFWGRQCDGGCLLNKSTGGPGTPGVNPSEETRAKISAAHTGKKFSAETRAKLSAAQTGNQHMKGKKLSEGAKAKLSAAKAGKNNPNYGKKRSVETKKKISAAKTGKKLSAETKKKISAAKTGKKHSAETKKKMSEAHKKRWAKIG